MPNNLNNLNRTKRQQIKKSQSYVSMSKKYKKEQFFPDFLKLIINIYLYHKWIHRDYSLLGTMRKMYNVKL
jgi:hypothetical protein